MSTISSAKMRELIQNNPFQVLPRTQEDLGKGNEPVNESAIADVHESQTLAQLKEILLAKSAFEILRDPDCNLALVRLAQKSECWIRDPRAWKRKSQRADQQLKSLLQHLVVKYKPPKFLGNAWTSEHTNGWLWFLQIAQGASIRNLKGLPFQLSKKMAHLLPQAPAHLDINMGFRWAQVRGMGGGEALFEAISDTFLSGEETDEVLLSETITWLIQQKELDYNRLGPLLNYIRHCWERGDYSLKGRTIHSVQRAMEAWQREVNREQELLLNGKDSETVNPQYPAAEVIIPDSKAKRSEMRYLEGTITHAGALRRFPKHMITITQVLNMRELHEEGKELDHCVGTYHSECLNAKTAIWSMRAWDGYYEKRILTIEFNLPLRKVVQIRGKCNRCATPAEMEILNEWAKEENITISNYI